MRVEGDMFLLWQLYLVSGNVLGAMYCIQSVRSSSYAIFVYSIMMILIIFVLFGSLLHAANQPNCDYCSSSNVL